ncbi:hypothetical protein IMSAG025_00478 [Muribaculaceae bacterium]|nr:hypothetical protein IMSAG025_00478 [Muribaculaceae bacterium]
MVIAVPKEKLGIMANPSTLITITLAAINISPKLFVKDCTIIIAIENIAWVRPEGNPRRIVVIAYFLCNFKYFFFISKISDMRSNFQKQRTADKAWAIAVANATPATPMPKLATNKISSTIFTMVAINR